MQTAIRTQNFNVLEAIFDERNDYGDKINSMIKLCLYYDKDNYDQNNELECQSFALFKRLLTCPKIDGLKVSNYKLKHYIVCTVH